MDDRDVYEISFDFSGATGDLGALLLKLEGYETRIKGIFEGIEKAAIGSATKATAELARLDKAIGDSLDNIQKKAAGRKKPIVIVEKKDVDEAKKNLDNLSTVIADTLTEVATNVEEQATEIADDIANAFKPPPTVVTDTQIDPGLPRTRENLNEAVFGSGARTQAYPPVPDTPTEASPLAGKVISPETEEALKRQQKEADLAERALIRLLAAELKVAAGADTVTKAYIENAAASAKNANAFLAQVEAIAKVEQEQGHLSRAQIQYATDVATTKAEIGKLNRELQDQAEAYDKAVKAAEREGTEESFQALQVEIDKRNQILAQIDRQVEKLRKKEDAQQRAAADVQKELEDEAAAMKLADAAAERGLKKKAEQEAAEKRLKAQREQAAQQFNKIARSLGVESTALNAVAQKYGIFEATIRKSGVATNALEKEIQDIIKQSPQLQRAVGQLTDGIEEFTIKADPSTFKAGGSGVLDPNEIRQLGFAFQRFGITGVAAFGEIYAAIGPAGIVVGIVTVGIVSLTKALVSMGRAGVEAFKKVVAASVELASKRETLAAGFEAYLGNAEAAAAALQEVDRISGQLGIDISPVAQSFLPEISSIKDLELLAEVAQSLALSKPGKTIEDTTVALRELRAGDVTSLRKQFEVPDAVLEAAKKAIDQTGEFVAGLQIIDEWQQRTGRSAEALGDTYAVSLSRGQEFLNTLGRDFGAPIVASLEETLNDVIGIVTDKESVLRGFAYGAGRVVADVIGTIADTVQAFIESIRDADIRTVLTEIYELGAATNLLFQQLAVNADLAGVAIGGVAFYARYLLLVLSGVVATVGLVVDGLQILWHTIRLVNPAISDSADAWTNLIRNVEQYRQKMAGIKDVLSAGVDLFKGTPADGVDEFADKVQGYIDDLAGADTAQLDEILASKQSDAAADLTEAIEKYLKELDDLQQDVRNKNLDLAVRLSDNILDFLEDVARKRKELALKNRDDLIDLEDEYERKVRDANQDLADDLEDADIEAGRNRLKQAREFADKRLEIEEDYQRKIAEIRRKYAFDLEEAARQNDAIAYLRLLRKREFDLNEARIDRDDALADVDTDEAKKVDEAARKRREDEEDARRSYKRKIRDLQQWLEDQEAEIKKNYKRELEAQARQEEEKRKEIMKGYQRDLRDLSIHYDQRLQELNKKYAEEYDLVGTWERKIVDLQQQIRSQFGFTNTGIGKNGPGGAGGRGLGDQPVRPGTDRQSPGHGGTTQASHSREWYEQQVERLARELGYLNIIPNIRLLSLAQLIRAYNNLLRASGGQSGNTGSGLGSASSVGGNSLSQPQSYNVPTTVSYRQPQPAAAYSYNNQQRNVSLNLSALDTSLLKREMIELIKLQLAQAIEEAF